MNNMKTYLADHVNICDRDWEECETDWPTQACRKVSIKCRASQRLRVSENGCER